jgi:hypothetical protein
VQGNQSAHINTKFLFRDESNNKKHRHHEHKLAALFKFKPTGHINNEARTLGHNDCHYLAVLHYSYQHHS